MNTEIQNATNATQDTIEQIQQFQHQLGRIINAANKTSQNTDALAFATDLGTLFVKAAIGQLPQSKSNAQTFAKAMSDYACLWNYALLKGQGIDCEPVVSPESDDSRFAASQWSDSLWFDLIKQSYLVQSKLIKDTFEDSKNLSANETRKLDFFTQQWIDSLAPTNFPLTNPTVLQEIQETKGKNLLEGMKNFADDLQAGRSARMVEKKAFSPGQNIAVTPGKVIARNKLAELIQYSPSTDKVKSVPILIIPPWINKYYILDLSQKNSFINWLVGQGYTVFVISWINPDESYRDVGYNDYLELGPKWAAEVIQSITNTPTFNAIGYCLGGTLLATYLGYLANRPQAENPVKCATFFTTMIDFTEPGNLGVFVDEQSVCRLEKQMEQTGYLDGKSMASTFSMMRSNDLIWHFVINNYLLGKSPGQFDLLYWNSDSTRMPAKMHSQYLRQMYLDNRLAQPGAMNALGTSIDLSKVRTPSFFVATEQDHIAPWKSVYTGAMQFSGAKRFVLGESGHIAGIINPPSKNKYGYWSSNRKPVKSPDKWLESADYENGSWWPRWERWLSSHSGRLIDARQPGSDAFAALDDAPGRYVKL